MANKTLTTGIITLTLATVSADTTDAAGGEAPTSTGAGNGWALPVSARDADHILLKFVDDGSGCTVVIQAGDNPPAMRKGIGALSFALTAAQVKYVVVETSRHMQDDGTITAYTSDAGTRMTAFILPRGA